MRLNNVISWIHFFFYIFTFTKHNIIYLTKKLISTDTLEYLVKTKGIFFSNTEEITL